MESLFCKVRFTGSAGATAGLVFGSERLRKMNLGEISRTFPPGEFLKMERLEVSPDFLSWDEAFDFDFEEGE